MAGVADSMHPFELDMFFFRISIGCSAYQSTAKAPINCFFVIIFMVIIIADLKQEKCRRDKHCHPKAKCDDGSCRCGDDFMGNGLYCRSRF